MQTEMWGTSGITGNECLLSHVLRNCRETANALPDDTVTQPRTDMALELAIGADWAMEKNESGVFVPSESPLAVSFVLVD